MRRTTWTLPAVLILTLAGCSFTPAVDTTRTEAALPETFTSMGSDLSADPARWWREFGDPVLNTVVDTALAHNFDLAQAVARVEEARQNHRIARAALLPSSAVSGGFQKSSAPSNTGFSEDLAATPGFPERFENDVYSVSGSMSYEVDLWGRVRANRNSAKDSYLATIEDVRAARIGVVSETIGTYMMIRSLEEQLVLAQANLALLQKRIQATEDRYERGLVSSFELYQIRQEFENTRTGIPMLEVSLAEAHKRLAILLGVLPSEARLLLGDPDTIPAVVEEPIPAGLPSDLLTARPDVSAAALRVDAAAAAVGAARAQRLPTISLTGARGQQSPELADLLNPGQSFSNLMASVTAPLFQGGALKANTRAASSRLDQAVLMYEKALLTAFSEVGATLLTFEKHLERLAFLEEEQRYAQRSLEAAEDRYRRGIGDYLAFLDAQRNLTRIQTARVTARQDLANARIAVYRALGGNWIETDNA